MDASGRAGFYVSLGVDLNRNYAGPILGMSWDKVTTTHTSRADGLNACLHSSYQGNRNCFSILPLRIVVVKAVTTTGLF